MKLRDLLQVLSQYDPDTTDVVIEDPMDVTSDIDFIHSRDGVVYLGTESDKIFKEPIGGPIIDAEFEVLE